MFAVVEQPLRAACAAATAVIVMKVAHYAFVVLPERRRLRIKRDVAVDMLDRQVADARRWLAETGGAPSRTEVKMVLSATAESLVRLQNTGSMTSLELLRIFVFNALAAHDKTNCLTWIDVKSAVVAAAAADESRRRGRIIGALHGLPLSVKDCIDIAGADSTAGLAAQCDKPAAADAVIVSVIREAGGVIFCKTNVPQTMLSFECLNLVFGRTTNPFNSEFTCGGSSGGEASLLALGGAAIGMGTDIGGSIRIPAHFCGICGLKPSQWRLSTSGLGGAYRGQEAIPAVVGPMARNVSDLITMFRVLTSPGALLKDGNVAGVPCREDVLKRYTDCAQGRSAKTLVFGYYVDDGIFPATPACRRAVLEAVEALEAAGHLCKPIDVRTWLGDDAARNYYSLLAADGGKCLSAAVGREDQIPHVAGLLRLVQLPSVVISAIASGVSLKDKMLASLLGRIRESNVKEYWALQRERQILRAAVGRCFAENELDAIVAPGLATPAVPHGSSKEASFGCLYTGLLNLLDVPTVAVPVTQTSADKDKWSAADASAVKPGRPMMTERMLGMYKPVGGLPVGVQVFSPKLCEEQALGCAAVLEAALSSRAR